MDDVVLEPAERAVLDAPLSALEEAADKLGLSCLPVVVDEVQLVQVQPDHRQQRATEWGVVLQARGLGRGGGGLLLGGLLLGGLLLGGHGVSRPLG
ncbi:MAG: hypothetical protein KC501_25055 [Myxococcales bacterium]|nr:hypothetical protein [Myxococcales bacterium]